MAAIHLLRAWHIAIVADLRLARRALPRHRPGILSRTEYAGKASKRCTPVGVLIEPSSAVGYSPCLPTPMPLAGDPAEARRLAALTLRERRGVMPEMTIPTLKTRSE
jgi:hypothetical protein